MKNVRAPWSCNVSAVFCIHFLEREGSLWESEAFWLGRKIQINLIYAICFDFCNQASQWLLHFLLERSQDFGVVDASKLSIL